MIQNRLVKHVEKPTRNFSQIPNWMIEGMGELSLLAQLLYLILYSQSPAFNPSETGLAKKIRNRGSPVGIETVKRAIKELNSSGYLVISRVGYNSYEWHIFDKPYHSASSASENNEGA